MRELSPEGEAFIKGFERLYLEAYLCPTGHWTLGWGHTGPDVGPGVTVTLGQAQTLFDNDKAAAIALVYRRIGEDGVARLAQHQFDALVSFVFNLGANAAWTIWKVLKAGSLDEAPAQLVRFVYGRDPHSGQEVKIAGLVRRRAAEVVLWHEADAPCAELPSGVTREIVTPPAPTDSTPVTQSKSVISAAGAAIAGGGVAVAQVSQAITPYAAQSHLVERAIAGLAMVGAVLAAAALIFAWWKKRRS